MTDIEVKNVYFHGAKPFKDEDDEEGNDDNEYTGSLAVTFTWVLNNERVDVESNGDLYHDHKAEKAVERYCRDHFGTDKWVSWSESGRQNQKYADFDIGGELAEILSNEDLGIIAWEDGFD